VLHIAQPALSQQVATLEGELNQQLLIRTKRGVTPTDAGKILYTHARAILRQCEQAQLAVHNVGHSVSTQVAVGFATETAASSITMPLLQAVRDEFPEVVIYLHEIGGALLSQNLINHQHHTTVIYKHAPVAGVSGQM
ncbi:LysR family transcriptional regulator, partial [Enterobacter cloacae]|uniref:LysR family transcriptional regulator n=1 Tax=Enterobacter cloacae TaxID=550 RepID=UPI0021D12FAB